MADTPSQSDFTKLQTDVALLKQFNEKVAEPTFKDIQNTQKDIKNALENLSYVPVSDFEDYKSEINERFKEMKRRTWVQNTMSATIGVILTLLITYVINDLLNR